MVNIRKMGQAVLNRLSTKALTAIYIDTKTGIVRIQFENKTYLFNFALDQTILSDTVAMIWEQFWHQNYKQLDVKGRQVLDIGGNVGDSAIYFAHKKAREIIYVEPYASLYKIAESNFKLNEINNIVMVKNPMGHPGYVQVDQKKLAHMGSSIAPNEKGKRTRCYSLKEMVKMFKLEDAVLKSDSEGAEYAYILEADTETLRHFRQMQMEYHLKGHKALEDHLWKAGFTTVVKFPLESPELEQQVGFIWADRQDETGQLL